MGSLLKKRKYEMVESITFHRNDFNHAQLLQDYREFFQCWSGCSDADNSAYVMDSWASVPMPLMSLGISMDEALHDRKLLFLPVHEPVADDQVKCIDGKTRDRSGFDVGVADSYGFVVELTDATVELHPALYDGSSMSVPNVNVQGTAACLEDVMTTFPIRCLKR